MPCPLEYKFCVVTISNCCVRVCMCVGVRVRIYIYIVRTYVRMYVCMYVSVTYVHTYNIIFKIKHKLYTASVCQSVSPLPDEKFLACTCAEFNVFILCSVTSDCSGLSRHLLHSLHLASMGLTVFQLYCGQLICVLYCQPTGSHMHMTHLLYGHRHRRNYKNLYPTMFIRTVHLQWR